MYPCMHVCMKCVCPCILLTCVDVSQSKVASSALILGTLIWKTASQVGHVRLHKLRNDRQNCFSKLNNVNRHEKCYNAKILK